MWQPGQQVLVQTLPWTLESDEFVLAVGVFAGEDGWDERGRLPVTDSAGLPVLDDGNVAAAWAAFSGGNAAAAGSRLTRQATAGTAVGCDLCRSVCVRRGL